MITIYHHDEKTIIPTKTYFQSIHIKLLDKIQSKRVHQKIAHWLFPKQVESHINSYEWILKWIDLHINYGLFTQVNIKKGDCIGHLTGQIIVKNILSMEYDEHSFAIGQLLFWVFVLDTQRQSNIFRFMNHSEEPSVELTPIISDKTGELIIEIHALHDIEPGQQITIHYGNRYLFGTYLSKISCKSNDS